MARSVVDLGKIKELNAAISAYSKGNEEAVMSLHQQALSLLSQFEKKLSALESIREQKAAALSRCEMRQSHDEKESCTSEERAYQKAYERCQRCEALVAQAKIIISEFENRAAGYRVTCQNLSSRAATGLAKVEAMIKSYSSDATPNTYSNSGNKAHVVSGNQKPQKGIDSPDTDSAIHISGGEQIASVLPKDPKTNPVKIDYDALSHKFDNLPIITEPDKATLNDAANNILKLLAAGGLVLGARELLLRQKADQIFEKQYGISRTELQIGTGSKKQKEYIEAYNNIYRGLKNEIKEVQKRKLKDSIKSLEDELSREEQKSIESIEKANRWRVDLENLKNDLMSHEDGKRRPYIPYEKTYIGGLSEKSLLLMRNQGKMTPGRYVTVLATMAQSDFSFVGQNKNYYSFVDGSRTLYIAMDGSEIRIEKAIEAGCKADWNVEAQGSLLRDSHTHTWNSNNPSQIVYNSKPVVSASKGFSVSAEGSCSVVDYSTEYYLINEKGGVLSVGYDFQGLKAHAEGALNLQSSMELEGRMEFSIAEGELMTSASPRPLKFGRTFYQPNVQGSIGLNAGASISGSAKFSPKGSGVKGGLSALLKVSANGNLRKMSLDDLPPKVAHQLLDYNPSIMDVINDSIVEAGKIELNSNRFKP